MKLITAIKIDVLKKTVEAIQVEDSLKGYYAALDCNIIERVRYDRLNDIVVDEEGLINENINGYFSLPQYPHPLKGHGLIVGTDGNGNWRSTKLTVEQIAETVMFFVEPNIFNDGEEMPY